MTNSEVVSLKHYFEALLEQRDKALALQAREYERRLDMLNHAHSEAQRVLNTYVSKITYEKDQEHFSEFKTRLEADLYSRGGEKKSFALIGGVIYSVVTVTIMAAGLLLSILK